MKISTVSRLEGTVTLPGDKSISHRSAMLAALAEGETNIANFASSADCASTLSCLEDLGIELSRRGNEVMVRGRGKRGFVQPSKGLDCGNSGTTMRLISGILAGQAFESTLIGDESLSGRPMKRVIAPLEMMGAELESTDGHAPLVIRGKNPLRAIEYKTPVASAQVKSCVLLAGLNADGETSVIESVPTRDHTERMLRWFGVDVREGSSGDGKKITVSGDAVLHARDIVVPSDISSAAFFLVAAACLEGSRLELPNVGLNSTRSAVIDVLRSCGADIEILRERTECNEPSADLLVNGGLRITGTSEVLKGGVVANLIDEVPILAVFGTQLEGGLEIRDAGELRVKESDRISCVVTNLKAMGADVEEFEDGLRVRRSHLRGTVLDSFGDHRIAMAFAVAGLMAEGDTEIVGAECAAVSFPEFFEVLREVAV